MQILSFLLKKHISDQWILPLVTIIFPLMKQLILMPVVKLALSRVQKHIVSHLELPLSSYHGFALGYHLPHHFFPSLASPASLSSTSCSWWEWTLSLADFCHFNKQIAVFYEDQSKVCSWCWCISCKQWHFISREIVLNSYLQETKMNSSCLVLPELQLWKINSKKKTKPKNLCPDLPLLKLNGNRLMTFWFCSF